MCTDSSECLFLEVKEGRVLFCQPRVEVTSCFFTKLWAMGLTFNDMINTQLIYRFELAQVVTRRITKTQQKVLGSNLTACSSFYSALFYFYFRGGGGVIILLMSYFFFLFTFLLFFIPLTCIRHLYKKTYVTTQTTLNSEIYAKE